KRAGRSEGRCPAGARRSGLARDGRAGREQGVEGSEGWFDGTCLAEREVSGVTTNAAREVPLLSHWRIPVWSAPRQQVARGAPTSVWGSASSVALTVAPGQARSWLGVL